MPTITIQLNDDPSRQLHEDHWNDILVILTRVLTFQGQRVEDIRLDN